jgi:hypothetical protein
MRAMPLIARFRQPAPRRPIAALALWAMLMMALVPTAGRLFQSFTSHGHAPQVAVELCTVDGRVMRLVDAALDPFRDPAPRQPVHAHEDCDYCVLASLAHVPSPLLAAVETPLGEAMRIAVDAPRVDARHPCGLGSRGPPASAA